MEMSFMRGGIWFCVAILVVILFTGPSLEELSDRNVLLVMLGIGLVSGCLGFCISRYDALKEKRKLENNEHLKRILNRE